MCNYSSNICMTSVFAFLLAKKTTMYGSVTSAKYTNQKP